MKFWYAIQCAAGREETARARVEKKFSGYNTFFPKRELDIRQNGKTYRRITPLFKGYFFISTKTKLLYQEALELVKGINETSAANLLYKVVGMVDKENSLGSDTLLPVRNDEMDTLLNLTQENEIVSFSSYLKIGDKVRIIDGPLKGLEALLIKINARKRRVKVAIDLFGEKQYIDLGASMVA